MNIITKLFEGSADKLINTLSGIVDQHIFNKEEKAELGLKIQKEINLNQENLANAVAEALKSEDIAISKRWESDMNSDSYLSKNARPITLLSLLGFVYLIITADSIDRIQFNVKESYIDLLNTLLVTVVVAYFGSRGWEKYTQMKNLKTKI